MVSICLRGFQKGPTKIKEREEPDMCENASKMNQDTIASARAKQLP